MESAELISYGNYARLPLERQFIFQLFFKVNEPVYSVLVFEILRHYGLTVCFKPSSIY